MSASEAYTFSSKPQAVQTTRKAGTYRNGTNNIMFDRRVVRGNTYAAQVVVANAASEGERYRDEHQKDRAKRDMLERRREERARSRARTPEPVPGRKNIDVQTENYLEELTDRVPEVDSETQTDALLDRPPSPLFMPQKLGIDVATQVLAGELFDFDREVEPILETLVGKTLEVAMMEVLEEEELAAIRLHQREFEQKRNVELAEVQRLEAEARRKAEEKARRMEQERLRLAREAEVREKVSARAFAKDYLTEMRGNVFSKLIDEGHFYDPVEKEVTEVFMPWLMDAVAKHSNEICLARQLTDILLSKSFETGRAAIAAKQKAREEAEQRAKEERIELGRACRAKFSELCEEGGDSLGLDQLLELENAMKLEGAIVPDPDAFEEGLSLSWDDVGRLLVEGAFIEFAAPEDEGKGAEAGDDEGKTAEDAA